MIDLDLSLPVNQVRLLVGDVDADLISDNNIGFVLTKNNDNIILASEEVLGYLLNMVAFYTREESGDVVVYYNQLYDRLKDRLDTLKASNIYSKVGHLFYFGGTSKTEISRVKNSTESVGLGFNSREFYEITESLGIDLDNPYYRY